MSSGTASPWKGLQTDRMPVFLSYDQAERMLAALLDQASAWRPDSVVGIARGGLVPGTMLSCMMALPLAIIGWERTTEVTSWIGPPAGGRRVLLVDDCCATGRTMFSVRAALLDQGYAVATMAIVHDPDTTRFVPDFSHAMRELFRFPWERGEATPPARRLRETGAAADRATEAPFFGLDLDGVFLPDVPHADYAADLTEALRRRHALDPYPVLPAFSPDRAVVITARPEIDRAHTEAWLARCGHGALPVVCRPPHVPDDIASVSRYKAEAATRWGCTHFVESEAEQAIRIAALAPHVIVSWWSARDMRGWMVGAAGQPPLPPPARA